MKKVLAFASSLLILTATFSGCGSHPDCDAYHGELNQPTEELPAIEE